MRDQIFGPADIATDADSSVLRAQQLHLDFVIIWPVSVQKQQQKEATESEAARQTTPLTIYQCG